MFAATLRRYARGCAFHQLEQRLLDAFAADVARNRRIFGLAANLVDFVDINDPALRTFNVIVRRLEQLENDILDILTDIASLSQRRCVGHCEGHIKDTRKRLRKQSLTTTRRPDEQDV